MGTPGKLDQFLKDSRTACKYGIDCYQKNPQHLQKYKHPPKQSPNIKVKENDLPLPKKPKLNLNNNDHCNSKESESVNSKLENNSKGDDIQIGLVLKENSVENVFSQETVIEDLDFHFRDSHTSNFSQETVVEDLDLHFKNSHTSSSTQLQLKEDSSSSDLCNKDDDINKNISAENDTSDESVHLQNKQSNTDPKQFILDKFLVKMPPDFFSFWDYCATINPDSPAEAFTNIGLRLVGPYDVLSRKISGHIEKPAEEYLIHWRYFYDPPEFQTIIKGPDATGYHIGYFRDDPNELPSFVGCNSARVNGEFIIIGDNIFAAISAFIENTLKSCDPFKRMSLTKMHSHIKAKAAELKLSLSDNSDKIKERKKKVLTTTFNKAGLVVPYNRKTQLGYRHLYVSNAELKKLLDRVQDASEQQRAKVLSELQGVLTATSIATDECDFGTGLELGWNILAHGVDSLNATIEQYLNTAYTLLNRQAFGKIASAHMANRRKGTNLSIL